MAVKFPIFMDSQSTTPVDPPVDPLDELLHPSGTASRRRAAAPSERTDS